MSLLGWLIVALLPVTPRFIIRRVARRYVAGETLEQALELVQELNRKGFCATLDVLGEDVTEPEQTRQARDEYLRLLPAISAAGVEANVSLKLTALGLKLNLELCWENLEAILEEARAQGNFIRIDMEDSSVTQATLDMHRKARDHYPQVGCVLQAYLHRTAADAQALISEGAHFRLCKGIYRESPEVAIQDYQAVRDNFLAVGKAMLDRGAYVGLATHDLWLIERFEQYLAEHDKPKGNYEFQALLGVPMEATLERLVAAGHKVRIYVPYGEHWLAYSKRRLKENPAIGPVVMKAVVGWPWLRKKSRT